MAYEAEISRNNPSCFLFLIDQSGSMSDPIGAGDGGSKRKADAVADAVNRILRELGIKCARSEGVRDYYHVGVIGYGARSGSAFTGPLSGREMVPISEVANSPARIETRTKKVDDGAGGLVDQTVKFPVWFEPIADGGTPMVQALTSAKSILENWVQQRPTCYPPVLINITDGESTDGDPTSIADQIRSLVTSDGNILLFNLHLPSTRAAAIEYPSSDELLPDQYAKQLFRISSILPPRMVQGATAEGFKASESSRGFVFNAGLESLIRFLDIGTRPANLR